ncbi:HlyD family secretion protein [Alloalcanivorax sp. C16-1]|uniref:HlyD family secretion protein n=1 Tax=Alloalcanivorax sp. C16-1 TaxID=3390051 RepID=UPI003970661F
MTSSSDSPRRPSRRLKLALLAILVLLCLVWMAFAIAHRLTHVSAQDARIMASQVTVSSRLDGWVTDFAITEGDRLKQGDTVARLYSEPEQRRLASLEAEVATQQAKVDYERTRLALGEQQFQGGLTITGQELDSAKAAEQAAGSRLTSAREDYKRTEALFKKGSISKQRRDQDYYAYQTARAEYQRAKQEVAVSQSQANNAHVGFLNGVQVPLPPPEVMRSRIKVAENELARARADLEEERVRMRDLQVPSPIAGVVNKTLVDQGEYVSAGQPLLMMHDPDDLWVEANIKETDIGELHPGQPVAITVDAYPDQHFAGEVRIVGRAATSQFALLPDPNPSGNFTKITQRIPVRIALTEGPVDRIGPGMMVEVDIDISGD